MVWLWKLSGGPDAVGAKGAAALSISVANVTVAGHVGSEGGFATTRAAEADTLPYRDCLSDGANCRFARFNATSPREQALLATWGTVGSVQARARV